MTLEEMLGPDAARRLADTEVPSLGLPLVLPHAYWANIRKVDEEWMARHAPPNTLAATAARATGLPGQDRGPSLDAMENEQRLSSLADREQVQGMPRSPGQLRHPDVRGA